MNTTSTLSERIRNARTASHLSQQQLADKMGFSDKSISAYEKGRSVPPLSQLKKLAKITNYPLAYFTQEEEISLSLVFAKLQLVQRQFDDIKKILDAKATV